MVEGRCVRWEWQGGEDGGPRRRERRLHTRGLALLHGHVQHAAAGQDIAGAGLSVAGVAQEGRESAGATGGRGDVQGCGEGGGGGLCTVAGLREGLYRGRQGWVCLWQLANGGMRGL